MALPALRLPRQICEHNMTAARGQRRYAGMLDTDEHEVRNGNGRVAVIKTICANFI